MKIAVLDYASGNVDIFEIPESEHIEKFLTEERGYNLEKIHWMEVKHINIHLLHILDF